MGRRFLALAFAVVLGLSSSLKVSLKPRNPPTTVSPNPCLVCHTLHIRSCHPAHDPPQTFNSRAPRQAIATLSETPTETIWPGELHSSHQTVEHHHPNHIFNGDQTESFSNDCTNEAGCGDEGMRTVCKIRFLFNSDVPRSWAE